MTLDEFSKRLRESTRAKLSKNTLRVWHALYNYIAERGETDGFDGDLIKEIHDATDKWVSDQTLQRHLKQMAEAELLECLNHTGFAYDTQNLVRLCGASAAFYSIMDRCPAPSSGIHCPEWSQPLN